MLTPPKPYRPGEHGDPRAQSHGRPQATAKAPTGTGGSAALASADTAARLNPASAPAPTLIEMAIAFVLRYTAVTSAIIGPWTMGHLESHPTAAEVDLSDEALSASTRSSRPA